MERHLQALSILSIALIVLILHSVRRQHIRVEYSVSWLGAALVLLILSMNSRLANGLTSFLALDDPGVAILFVVLCVFLFVFYRFSLRISALKDANIALAQRLAILEFHQKSLNEGQKKTEG